MLIVVAAATLILAIYKPWTLLVPDPTPRPPSEVVRLLQHKQCNLSYIVPTEEITQFLALDAALEYTGEPRYKATAWVLDDGVLKLGIVLVDDQFLAVTFCWTFDGSKPEILDIATYEMPWP